jgi:hypothetical protein
LDFAHGDDQRLCDGLRRIDLYGNYFRGLRRGDSYRRDNDNGLQYANVDLRWNDGNAVGMY